MQFYAVCAGMGLLLGLMWSLPILQKLWNLLRNRHIIKARVIEKQKVATELDGHLSFESDGDLDQYNLWLEIMDKSLVRQLGIAPRCSMEAADYRKDWDYIPKYAEASICLEKKTDDETGEVDWSLKWVELTRSKKSGAFVVYKE
jgi:hypothetical protein